MNKILKIVIPSIVLLGIVCFVKTNGMAFSKFEKPEVMALNDYKLSKKNIDSQNGYKSAQYGSSEENLKLSKFSIPICNISDGKKIKSYEGKNVSGLLETSTENLWFMMNGTEAEGIVVADNTKPIKMGGKNRSKDLLKIYNNLKNTLKTNDVVKYFEYQGQGVFVHVHENKEDIYLSEGASKVLQLPNNKSLPSDQVIKKIKDKVAHS